MKKQLILIAFAFLLVLPLVASAPPVTQVQQFGEGFDIRIPQDTVLLLNQDYEFEVHVYNISNGMPIISDIDCYFHLYNSTGKHQLELWDNASSHTFGNFSEQGFYYYNIQCNSSSLGGYHSQKIEVTRTGVDNSEDYVAVIIALIGAVAILLTISRFTNGDHPVVSIFLMVVSLFLIQPIVNLSMNIMNNATTSEVMSGNASSIFNILPFIAYGVMAYMVVYILIMLLTNLGSYKEAKKRRREEGE